MAVAEIKNVLVAGKNLADFDAGADIVAGQAVAFADTGVSMTVHPAVKGTTGQLIGVATKSALSGKKVKVAMNGCIVKVTADGAAIDAGDEVEDLGTTDPGEVGPMAGSAGTRPYVLGLALDDIGADATGNILINCYRATIET